MQYVIVTIKDRAIDAFLRPFFAIARGQAARIFTDEVNNQQSEMHKHPEDYDLYFLGTWDDATAKFDQVHDAPQLILRGQDARNSA